jgi:hypothetical protein
MHSNNNSTIKQDVNNDTPASYKLYNLLFAGKISLPDYFKAVKTLQSKSERN